MQKGDLLYQGKAKSAYLTDNPDQVVMVFRDDTSAFDGVKLAKLAGKGAVNNKFNSFIMQTLEKAGIETHFIQQLSDTEALVKRLDMVRVECVVRNVAAGGLSKRLGIPEGEPLNPPVFEFFLKDDALHDPMINESHILSFGWATEEDIRQLKEKSMAVNNVLKPLFAKAGMTLVDYKLEFGHYHGRMVLGDEFTPDGCRIWDTATNEKLDKDRFRRDLGQVIESYQLAAQRLGVE
jgi:phosphoribosylaminoimidazole-succinocarboxamide synthase